MRFFSHPFRTAHRQIRRKWLVCIVILLLSSTAHSQEYTIMTEDFPPFGYMDNGKLTGLSVEIVRAILDSLALPDNIQVLPWARVYREGLRGPKRIVFSMARNADRESQFKWVGPLFSDRVFFYKRAGEEIVLNTLEDAKHVPRIVLTRGFPEHNFLRAQGFTNLELTVKPVQNLRMLVSHRGSLVPMGELAIRDMLSQAHIEPQLIERTSLKLFEVKLFIAFSKDNTDTFVASWQTALDTLKSTGIHGAIMNKYTLPSE